MIEITFIVSFDIIEGLAKKSELKETFSKGSCTLSVSVIWQQKINESVIILH